MFDTDSSENCRVRLSKEGGALIMRKYVLLDKWEANDIVGSPVPGVRLRGVVNGHPFFDDGSYVFTTRVLEGIPAEGAFVKTKNTLYYLGKRA